ncbi:MAG: tetratricopeptide repeat protein [Myxococcota bacterium]
MSLDERARAGLKAIEESRFDDAITAFVAALELDSGRPDLNHALGMAYFHRGDVGNAIAPLEAAVELSRPFTAPEHQALRREFFLSLASAYQTLDRVADARRTLEQVVATWPDAVEARLQLGQLLLMTGAPTDGCEVYAQALDWLDKDQRASAEALVGCTREFLRTEHPASVFLEAHCESYRQYFDEVAAPQVAQGWYAEATRMRRTASGQVEPVVPDGARPYALSRVDLVNPADGQVSGVYSESEPMIVAVQGLEPLAQVPVLFPWSGHPFAVWVSTRCAWHWLSIVIRFDGAASDRLGAIDAVVGGWYLAGFNGEFGEADRGRVHYVTDPEPLGPSAVSYVVDLGRAKFDAIPDLLRRLGGVPGITAVVFGEARVEGGAR